MEYGALVQSCGFGSLLECGSVPEEDQDHDHDHDDLIDELLVQGCWVATSCETHYVDELSAKRWWIEPKAANLGAAAGPCSSVKHRLVVAVAYLRQQYTNNNNNNNNNANANVLIQIWVPLRRPLALGPHYHTNPDDSSVAFPINDINPTTLNSNVNLRFFSCDEYPRLPYDDDVAGSNLSLALPVFERGTAMCLGVLHFLMPLSNDNIINYHRPQLDNSILLNTFQGVDLRSCENLVQNPGSVKVFEEVYEGAVNEIMEVLRCVCKTQNLPLGLTWAPCSIQQGGKCGYGHSSDNYVSSVDRACFVADPHMLGFHEACSQHHLFRGQGIVGTAFSTGKPCFATDITAFTKAEYPLSHHAHIFGLHAAVAIPLRTVYTDFVLELFLPKDCLHREHQTHFLNSLSLLLQQACRTLHLVIDDEFALPPPPPPPPLPHVNINNKEEIIISHKSESHGQQEVEGCGSWIAHMMEAQAHAQQKGKGVCVSLEYMEADHPKEEFKVTTICNWDTTNTNYETTAAASHDQVFSDFGQESHSHSHTHSFGARRGRKAGEKRRTKAEKTISLPLLRQYFAGSLKDAAKSIGVCPTTLKRICRQHGITRWPSRKIKKVGHSLKKLQLVIDSVQGAEGAIQIGSFYNSFPELNNSSTSESSKSKNNNTNTNTNTVYGHGLKSPSSSSPSTVVNTASESPIPQHFMSEITCQPFRVKATFADEKIRFSLQPMWGFIDLQLEIARRFNLNDVSNVVLKYLDDEGEWVVLACDGDLEECKDLHSTSHSRTIRLALFQASPLNLPNTFANTSPS